MSVKKKANQKKRAPKKPTYYESRVWPVVARTLVKEDQGPDAKADFRREWRRLERIPGIQTLIKKGDHKSVLAIFDACTSF